MLKWHDKLTVGCSSHSCMSAFFGRAVKVGVSILFGTSIFVNIILKMVHIIHSVQHYRLIKTINWIEFQVCNVVVWDFCLWTEILEHKNRSHMHCSCDSWHVSWYMEIIIVLINLVFNGRWFGFLMLFSALLFYFSLFVLFLPHQNFCLTEVIQIQAMNPLMYVTLTCHQKSDSVKLFQVHKTVLIYLIFSSLVSCLKTHHSVKRMYETF